MFDPDLHYAYLWQCSEGFMHTRMRRRVESLIQVPLHFYLLIEVNFVVITKNLLVLQFCLTLQ